MIDSMEKLSRRLDVLYRGISPVCRVCNYKDCQGFVWLLPEEAERLRKRDVPILEVNKKILFIHSFPEKNGEIVVDERGFPCLLCKSKRCTVHSTRPLVCRLYPIGFATEGKRIFVVLHQDCLFVRKLADGTPAFERAVEMLFADIDARLLSRIVRTYSEVENIAAYPVGRSDYVKLFEVGQIIKKRPS